VGVKNRFARSPAEAKKPYKAERGPGAPAQGSIRAQPVGWAAARRWRRRWRDHEYHVPKKVRKAALRAAISKRNQDKMLVGGRLLDPGEKPSTKAAVGTFVKLGIDSARWSWGVKANQKPLQVAVRNAPRYKFPCPSEGRRKTSLRHPAPPYAPLDQGRGPQQAPGGAGMNRFEIIKRPARHRRSSTACRDRGRTSSPSRST